MTWRAYWFLPCCCAALVIAAAAGCHKAASHGPAAPVAAVPAAAVEVPVTSARLEVWPQTVRVQGSLLADEQAVIGSKLSGRVEDVHGVELGSVVQHGQTLVTLERRELDLRVQQAQAQLRQACAAVGLTPDSDEGQLNPENSPPVLVARAALEEAQAAFVRGERLRPRQVVTEAEFEQIQAALKTAQAQYKSAVNDVHEQIAVIGQKRADLALTEQQLADAVIVAPFDGIIMQRQVSPGQSVQVGQAVVTLVRVSKLRFTAGVPESMAHLIRQGQTIEIRLAGEPQPVLAKISRLSPAVTLTSRALWIEADVENPALRWQAGLFAEADIIVNSSAEALTIPAAAIRDFAGIQKVWVVKEGKAAEHTVRVGRRTADRVEILGGLAAGDEVVSKSAAGKAGPVIAMHSDKATGSAANGPTGLTE